MWKIWAFLFILSYMKLTVVVQCCSTTTKKPTTTKPTTKIADQSITYAPNPCPDTFPLFVK